jgi:hypothetical protein
LRAQILIIYTINSGVQRVLKDSLNTLLFDFSEQSTVGQQDYRWFPKGSFASLRKYKP